MASWLPPLAPPSCPPGTAADGACPPATVTAPGPAAHRAARTMVAVKPLPVLAPACSLSEAEVHQQLARYRAAGEGALLLECAPGRRAGRIASHVPDSL